MQPRVVAKQPDERVTPVRVDVAPEVTKRLPPVMVTPAVDARPAVWIPPVNVEVAADVLRKEVSMTRFDVVALVVVPFVAVSAVIVEDAVARNPDENVLSALNVC